MRRTSRRKGQRQFGVATHPRATKTKPTHLKMAATRAWHALSSHSKSTRKRFRVENAVSHSKQRIGASATRKWIGGSSTQKGDNQNQVFPRATHSKQTIEAFNKCQFFAIVPRRHFLFSNFQFPMPFRYSYALMLDLGYVREHLDAIEKMARDRGATIDLDAFRGIDEQRRKLIFETEQLKAHRLMPKHENACRYPWRD